MIIYLKNYSRYPVQLSMDEEILFLPPSETITVQRNPSKDMKITLKSNSDSYKEKQDSRYHLVIESEYMITHIKDGDMLKITREKVKFDIGIFYERLFLRGANLKICSEAHRIVSEEKIKRIYKRAKRLNDFVFGPLESSTGLVILLIIMGFILMSYLKPTFGLIYFPLMYLFLVAHNQFVEKFLRYLDRKMVKKDRREDTGNDTKDGFYHYFENEFIQQYYANPRRKPLMGEIEIDDET